MQGLGLGRPYSQLRQYSTRVLIWDARLAGLVRNGGAETRRRRRLGDAANIDERLPRDMVRVGGQLGQ